MISALKPTSRLRVYDLVREAGVDVATWSDYKRSEHPASNPNYCYEWAFEGRDRVVLCLWLEEMRTENTVIYQELNYRAIAAARRNWNATQRRRAAAVDHAIQYARLKRVPIRVIVVDGSRRADADDSSSSKVERRLLDAESWHVALYDDDGNCRLQRGAWPPPTETFTAAEIAAAGTFVEGGTLEVTSQVRQRSARLRELARRHFAAQSSDGRLHCSVCDWAPPSVLALSGPIVEIHHEVGISSYPAGGKALIFEEAIRHFIPLCPNCHRMIHAKPGGGTFPTEFLRGCLERREQTTAATS